MKKKTIVLYVFCVAILAATIFVSCEKDNFDESRENLKTEMITRFNFGISVENDAINGTYLKFSNDSILIKFSEYLLFLSEEEKQEVISLFEKDGFTSLNMFEKKNLLTRENNYPDRDWAYILNQSGYFKVGDILYKDENQEKLFVVDSSGSLILIKSREKDNQLKSSSCFYGGKISKTFGAYPAGVSGMPTLVMDAYIEHKRPWVGDQSVVLYSSLAVRPPDGYLSAATGNFTHYCDFNFATASGTVSNTGNFVSGSGKYSFTNVLAKSQFICVGYVYTTFTATRADGKTVTGQLRMEQ
jgi:hypothetical protein